jgi:dCTP deaminase
VLSDAEIMEHLRTGEIKLEPSDLSSCLNPAGYDLRCSETVVLKPKQYELVATLETVELGLNVTAYLHIRSSLAREGVVGSFAVVDPGFRGQLTLNLHNVSEKEITLREGECIVQIVFHKLGNVAQKGYNGSYQNSKGIVSSRRHKHDQAGI